MFPPLQRLSVPPALNPLALAIATVALSPPALGADEGATAAVRLPTIVVTATRTEKAADEAPVRTEVVGRDEIERTHARSLKEALENVPGLQLQEVHGKSGYQLSLQGLTSDQVLVLVDGLPITASTGSTVDLSQYSLAEVERIEVVKGATSAQYGSSAMGGVINVITRRIEAGRSGAVTADVGSYGRQNIDGRVLDDARRHGQLRLEGGGQRLRARIAGDVVDDAGFTTDASAWTRRGDAVRRQQYTARLDGRPAPAGLFWIDGHFYREDNASRYELYAPPRYVPQRKTEAVDRDRYSGGASWSWSDGTRLELKGVDERYAGRTRQFSNDTPSVDRLAEQGLDHLGLQLDLPVWRQQLWTFGGDYHRETLAQTANGASELETRGRAIRSSRELFAQDDIVLGDDWELLLGGRWQDDSDFGGHAVPRLSLRGKILRGDDWTGTLRLSAGQGYRVPNLKERHFLFDHSAIGYKVIGNPDLEPERSDSFQAGWTLSRGASLSADLNLFRNDVRDLIQTDLDNARIVDGIAYYTYENIARAFTQGAEASLRWQATPALILSPAYTYTDTEDRGTGAPLTRRPRHMARLGIDGSLPTHTDLSLRARYQSREHVDSDSDARSPAWATLDLKLNQSLGDGVAAFAGIDNLFNVQRDFADSNDFSPIVGRFIYLGLRYAWDRH